MPPRLLSPRVLSAIRRSGIEIPAVYEHFRATPDRDVFDIQSHTHFLHRVDAGRRPILFSRNYHNILFDFARSRRALSQFNPHVLYLSYPFGGYNATAVQAANDAGFHMAVTTVRGKVKPGTIRFC